MSYLTESLNMKETANGNTHEKKENKRLPVDER